MIPGHGRIGRNITYMVREGATEITSSCKVATDFPAGKTVRIDLGGTGRPVVGKLAPPEGSAGKARWNFAMVDMMSASAETEPDSPFCRASIDRDGSFRIDDVPAGDYLLSVRFHENDAGHLFGHRVHVPPVVGDREARPVDLGVLRLEKP